MDHGFAVQSKATERYLLGEMSELERHAFEEHYFSCATCADDVRSLSVFLANARAVFAEQREHSTQAVRKPPTTSGWRSWFSRPAPYAVAAALALAFVTAYQSLFLLPRFRRATSPQAMAPLTLRGAARGEEPTYSITSDQLWLPLSADINAFEPRTSLKYTLTALPGGKPILSGHATAPPPGAPLLIIVPASALPGAGMYELVLESGAPDRGTSVSETAHYRFVLEISQSRR